MEKQKIPPQPELDSAIRRYINAERKEMYCMFSLPADELERLDGLFARIEQLGRECKDMKEFLGRYIRKPLYQEKFRMWGDYIVNGYLHPWALKMINDNWEEQLAAVGRRESSAVPLRAVIPAASSALSATMRQKSRTRVCKLRNKHE